MPPKRLGLLPQDEPVSTAGSFHDKLDALARRLLSYALAHSGGNQAQAARLLGLLYHQFRCYVRKYLSPTGTCPRCGAERKGEQRGSEEEGSAESQRTQG